MPQVPEEPQYSVLAAIRLDQARSGLRAVKWSTIRRLEAAARRRVMSGKCPVLPERA